MCCVTACAILAFSLLGQEAITASRSAELRERRQAKARQLEPEQQNRAARFLFKLEDDLLLERVLNPPRGVYLRVGGIGEGAGFGAGPGYRYSTGQYDFRVSGAGSLKGYAIAEASLALPGAIKDGPYVELYARRRDFPQEDFFGIGPDTAPESRTNFALRDTFLRVSGGLRTGGMVAGVRAGYLDPRIGSGTDRRMPSTDEFFAPIDVPGLAEQPAFVVLEPFVEFATTDPPLNPTTGSRIRLSFSRHSDRDLERFSFRRWDLDARQYIPLFHRARTIVVRVRVSSSTPDTAHQVPFYLQPTLGGAYSLRGFRTFRFRDRSLALVQAEYRWRINEFVSGALFYDTGAVAPRLSDLGRLERDYGFGLRAGGRNGVAFRADIAFGSGEGTRFLVRFDNVF
jgi:hypothetical protein